MKACLLTRGKFGNHQHSWATAFAEGMRRHGHQAELVPEYESCDLLVLWSVRKQDVIREQLRAGGQVCILERGYVGDRFAWASVSFGGGLNGRAAFRGVSADPARFEQHFGHLLQPWATRPDGYTLLIGQVPGDMSLMGLGGSLRRWYVDTAAALKEQGQDVRFRPHPLAYRRGEAPLPAGLPVLGGDLASALAGAGRVVTFNSNTGVESVLAGVPTMAADPGSMAWAVTSHGLEDPVVRPDRTAWAAELAWKQWSMDEMRAGDCWAHVGTGWSEKQCA